jgi:hypothetical protein
VHDIEIVGRSAQERGVVTRRVEGDRGIGS